MIKYILTIIAIIGIFSCQNTSHPVSDEDNGVVLPLGFPPLPINLDNPLTKVSIELGRKLFYDTILSNGGISCASCHKQRFAFSDGGNHVSFGFQGRSTTRNALSIVNVAYYENYNWDGKFHGSNAIEEIVKTVVHLPFEFNCDSNTVNERLRKHPEYPKLIKNAYGESAEPNLKYAAKAIANFVRSIISGNSRYDKFVKGDTAALNESEKRGLRLFFSDRTKCSECHSGHLFTDNKFHSTGITTHYFDRGRFLVTDENEDRGKFRTPTLRNIALTAPYMHNGEILTLEEIMQHYNNGGKIFINKDKRMKPLGLSQEEIKDLINFLHALTDEDLIKNPKYSKPL